MALGSNISGPGLDVLRGQQYIPEKWLSEVQFFREAYMLNDNFVKTWKATLGSGDTWHIPRVNELSVEDKASGVPVAVQSNNDGDYTIQVDTDRTTSVFIDDLLAVQSSYDVRSIHMKAIAYALAKDLTGSILGQRAGLFSYPAQNVFTSSTGTIAGNGGAFTLAAFLLARKTLLEADVERSEMMLLISPSQEAAMLAIPQFTSIDYGNKRLEDRVIGSILGVPVLVSSLVGANSATGWRNGTSAAPEPTPGVLGSRYFPRQSVDGVAPTTLPLTFTGNAKPVHTAVLAHKEWCAAVISKSPKITYSFENRDQGHLMVARSTYGSKLYRPNHAVNIHTTGDVV
jgi:Phage capsid protein